MRDRSTSGQYIIYPVEYVDPKPSPTTDLFDEKPQLDRLLGVAIDSILGRDEAKESTVIELTQRAQGHNTETTR
jgi:hypothetical protein